MPSRRQNSSDFTVPLKATVEVDPDTAHPLPRTQYGHFIEHIGRCIKGGVWAEGEAESLFLGGVRPQLVQAMRSINPALIRYPGGCFADGYHWKDGIGPRETRPRRRNRAWWILGPGVGPVEDNHFGTDEFLQLCEAVGAEAQLTVNVGSGTANEAADWVEYCNGPAGSRWGDERVRNGHPEPYGVKYWFVGNEIFGIHEVGHQSPRRYVETVKEYAREMRRIDPEIRLIGCGNLFPPGWRDTINRTILEGAGQELDYLSIHLYAPGVFSLKNHLLYSVLRLKGRRSRWLYYQVIGSLRNMERFIAHNVRDVRTFSPPGKRVGLSFDEWNLWFVFRNDVIQSNFNLRDGLWTASMLNLLHRYAPEVPLANIAQMVNCLGIIHSTSKGTFLTPSALVFQIYTEHAGDMWLSSHVDCPPIPHQTALPALDVSATRAGNRLSLFLINRHYDAEVVAQISLHGLTAQSAARRIELTHSNPVQYNTFQEPEAVRISERLEALSGTGSAFEIRLAPHSLTCLRLDVFEDRNSSGSSQACEGSP
jgi:alpha-N-arabinofuranosidase